MNYYIQAFKTLKGEFYWRLISKNKKILATSEMYTRKEWCMKTANKLSKSFNTLCKVTFLNLQEDYEE